jgi:hypothetical protein
MELVQETKLRKIPTPDTKPDKITKETKLQNLGFRV